MNEVLSYSQVALIPRYSTLRSRSEADVSVEFLGRRFQSCVIPANMQSVINADIACWLSQNDYPYIYHRFSDTLEFVRRANQESWKLVSISVGVKQGDKDLLTTIVKEGLRVDWITIDVAMGHHVLVKEMIEFIKGLSFSMQTKGDIGPDYSGHPISWSTGCQYVPKIIAGNVATPEGVRDLTQWGADAIKIGIAGGAACHTKQKTGFHVPMFSCVKDCVKKGGPIINGSVRSQGWAPYPSRATVPIIADGGVRENGDIAKALVAASGVPALVMIGSLIAACVDAPGENVYAESDKQKVLQATLGKNAEDEWLRRWFKPIAKTYWGSASHHQKGESKHIEGVYTQIPCNGMTVAELYQDIKESLQSAVSYAGGDSLAALKDVRWVEIK